ncbi:hypothetical protein [Noviherbaspirillum malthae]|uniref:hypothetical protein n=1 Tax=Noviherbaspirillum malthae TaxID=1260987 RepID=UPI001890ABA4|nr:hypothetical protein [Noviherbaspirillum malthae]
MSELLRIDELKADAERAANEGKSLNANPHAADPRRGPLWKHYFLVQQTRNETSHSSHCSAVAGNHA